MFYASSSDCTEESCLGDTVHAQKSFFPDFNRTFTWDLKVNSTRAFDLDFSETGLRQIPNEEMCPDDNTYSIVIYPRSGLTNIGTFCKGGPVTSILGRYKGRVTLTVPGNAMLDPVNFKLKVGPETKSKSVTVIFFSIPAQIYHLFQFSLCLQTKCCLCALYWKKVKFFHTLMYDYLNPVTLTGSELFISP